MSDLGITVSGNKTTMSKEGYAKYILLMLGGSVVDIELEQDIESFLDMALLKVKPYVGSTKYITIPASSCTDLRKLNIYTIVNVYRGAPIVTTTIDSLQPSTSGTNVINQDLSVSTTTDTSTKSSDISDDSYLFNPGLFNYVNNVLGLTATDSVAITILTNQLINQASGRSSDIEFDYEDGFLYLELAGSGCSEVTLEYIPNYSSVEEVTDPFWINYILNIAVAMTKIALGRARGKYKMTNLPYELDSDTLLNEGSQELENCMNKLEELNDLDYILD